jgi:manganese efflux pump family protein
MVAVSLGLSNLAAAIGLGTSGVSAAIRLRVALNFGLFEAGMPIIGLLIGHDLASAIGREARWVGATLLVGVGCYGIVTFIRKTGLREIARNRRRPPDAAAHRSEAREWIKVAFSGFALSLDNLVAGFALGSYQVSLVTGALVFGVVSVAMSLAGLEFGARLGGWVGDSGELFGGVVLVGVGLAIGFGLIG